MKPLPVQHQRLRIEEFARLPEMSLKFAACRVGPETHFCDIVNIGERLIDRWSIPRYTAHHLMALLEAGINPALCPVPISFLLKETQSVHVAQLSRNGHLIITRGNFYYGASFYFVDTNTCEGFAIEDDCDEPMLYTSTGAFSPDQSNWVFVRWPARHTIEIINGTRAVADCEIVAFDLFRRSFRVLHRLQAVDHIHQVTYSADGRWLVFTSFKASLRKPYPKASIEQAPDGYRESHEAGIISQPVMTLDLASGQVFQTPLPRPVSAHLEFDPVDSATFYVSAHNFSVNSEPSVVLEGPGAIFKLRLDGQGAKLDGAYAPQDLFRVSQHVPFTYRGRTILAITNTPNKLDLVDARSMTLWRRETLFPWDDLDFSRTGSAISPAPPQAFFSLNPSSDGRYIVLESSESFHVYATDEGRFIEQSAPRQIPSGCGGSGHTRLVGR